MVYAKILVVEDESIVAKDIEFTLKGLGYAVVAIASSGEQAIKEAENRRPNLILMDIKLKGEMDGIEAAQRIHDKLDIPIIYLTAFADYTTLSRAKITEPFGYIVKPFEEKELHSVIEMALYKHKLASMLRDSEKRYKDLYDTAPDGYLSTNANCEIIEANDTLLKMLGYASDEVKGENLAEFVNEKEVKGFKETCSRLLARERIPNFECKFMKKGGEAIAVQLNASADFDDAGNLVKLKLIVRDVSEVKELEQEKKALADKVIKLTKKIPLTDNEKKVFYGIVRYPLSNDIELSKKLKIKRSTVTSIKNKLRRSSIYYPYRIPNLSMIGCELMTVIHTKFTPANHNKIKKFSISREAGNAPEQVYLSTTEREMMGICISRNLTDFKKHLDNVLAKYRQYDLLEHEIDIAYFPFETSKIERLFDYAHFLKSLLEIEADEPEESFAATTKKKKLTGKEKLILYALVKFPELNDSEIAEKTKLPRPTVSQTRRRLIKGGFLNVINVPNHIELRCELLVLNYIAYSSKLPESDIEKAAGQLKNTPSLIFMARGNFEVCTINIYDDYTEYEAESNKETAYYGENKIVINKHTSEIFPIPQIQFHKLDFAPLVKKVLEINADF